MSGKIFGMNKNCLFAKTNYQKKKEVFNEILYIYIYYSLRSETLSKK